MARHEPIQFRFKRRRKRMKEQNKLCPICRKEISFTDRTGLLLFCTECQKKIKTRLDGK